jgi:hypothetical protein
MTLNLGFVCIKLSWLCSRYRHAWFRGDMNDLFSLPVGNSALFPDMIRHFLFLVCRTAGFYVYAVVISRAFFGRLIFITLTAKYFILFKNVVTGYSLGSAALGKKF